MDQELLKIIIVRSIIVVAVVLVIGIILILEKKYIIQNKNKYLTRFFQKFELILSGNMISIYRIIGGPICGYLLGSSLYYQDYNNHDVLIPAITLLAMGDFLDGVVARSCNAESILGMILDPLGDKVMIISIFIGITTFLYLAFGEIIFLLFVLLMAIPEVVGTFLRSKMSNPAAKMIGKIKTSYQFLLLGIMYYAIVNNLFINNFNTFIALMLVGITLTCASAATKINFPQTKTAGNAVFLFVFF